MDEIIEKITSADPVALIFVFSTIIVFVIPIFILFPPLPVESFDVLGQTHSKIGIKPEDSKLPRQVSNYASRTGKLTVESLWIFPVKSCTGIEVQRSKVLPSGMEYDRLYTFAWLEDGEKGIGKDGEELWKFLTLRQFPLMANIRVDLWLPDESKNSRALGRPKEGFLVVKFPWKSPGLKGALETLTAKLSRGFGASPQKEFLLPLEFPSEAEQKRKGYEYKSVKIWAETPVALDMGSEVPKELREYLGQTKGKFGLFRMDPVKQRHVLRNAPREKDVGYQPKVDFQDAYPLHLTTLESLADLESKVEKDADLNYLDPRRFRANIITSGAEAWDEDTWRNIRCTPRVGEAVAFDVSARMVRCKLPNVNPDTGIKHRVEPDKAMRKYRDVDEGAPKMGCFGMSLCPIFEKPGREEDRVGVIETGMEIEVRERGEHLYIDM